MTTTVNQKRACTITDADGNDYTHDGHIYFTPALARDIAREIGGMWYDANRTSLKTVVAAR